MPKNTKKRKDKAADFSKAKLKLGKGKQVANNVIDTSFKARSIALPSQKIAQEHEPAGPTTRRKQTFEDLLSQLKHYNAGTRKDAILGLQELWRDHDDMNSPKLLTPLLNGCARLIGDEDASVRKTLRTFLTRLLHRLSNDQLIPYAPMLLLFTTSAQTHIFPEIRVDATRVLDILIDVLPTYVVQGWNADGHGRRVLEGLFGVLNAGTAFGGKDGTEPAQATSTASVVLSPASKSDILKTLYNFLKNALPSNLSEDFSSEFGFMRSAFASSEAFQSFDLLLEPLGANTNRDRTRVFATATEGGFLEGTGFPMKNISDAWSFDDLTASTSASLLNSSALTTDLVYIMHLATTLHPILVSTFLDCAPALTAGGTLSEIELDILWHVLYIARIVYKPLFSGHLSTSLGEVTSNLGTLVEYVAPYFPFIVPSAKTTRHLKLGEYMQAFNVAFCDLATMLASKAESIKDVTPISTTNRKRCTLGRVISQNNISAHIDRVSDYVVKILEAKTSGDTKSSFFPRAITPESYALLLPVVWTLLTSSDDRHVCDVLSALLQHSYKRDGVHKIGIEMHTIPFLGRLLLLSSEPDYIGLFETKRHVRLHKPVEEWILLLLRQLWELGARHETASQSIILLLLRMVQRKFHVLQQEVLDAIASRLTPYMIIDHNDAGKVNGPFGELPKGSHTRNMVMDLALCLLANGHKGGGLSLEAIPQVLEANDKEYWIRGCRAFGIQPVPCC